MLNILADFANEKTMNDQIIDILQTKLIKRNLS